jgi:hypothetical protein
VSAATVNGNIPAAAAPSGPELVRRLGPGLITGAADDDPSGIATYSQVGAQFGMGLRPETPRTGPTFSEDRVSLVRERLNFK